MSMLSRIGIILTIVSIYILIKNLDNPSGNILQLCLAGIVLGVILFFVGLKSKEEMEDINDEDNDGSANTAAVAAARAAGRAAAFA